MLRNVFFKKTLSIILITSLFIPLTITLTLATAQVTSFTSLKAYEGPKEVFKDADRGKPPGTPGNGPPENPDEPEPGPDISVNKWAVIIGISDYRGRSNDLQYCDEDAEDIYDYLINKGYPAGNIKLLIDGEAKAKSIIAALDWLASWENADSEVVFFYSGHGSTYDGYNDGDDEWTDEAIVSADLYLILDGQLRQKFASFESNKISITFDSCFSGGMNDLASSGRVVVAACGEEELSYDGPSWMQNGVFTYYYLEGLNLYNTIEGAFIYSKPLASDFVSDIYDSTMTPQMDDKYSGDWGF